MMECDRRICAQFVFSKYKLPSVSMRIPSIVAKFRSWMRHGIYTSTKSSEPITCDIVAPQNPQEARHAGDLMWFYGKLKFSDLESWTPMVAGLTHTISDDESCAIRALVNAKNEGESYLWRRALLVWVEMVSGHGRYWYQTGSHFIALIQDNDPGREFEIARRVSRGVITQGWWKSIPHEYMHDYAMAQLELVHRIGHHQKHLLLCLKINLSSE